MRTFYVVWEPEAGPPRYRHDQQGRARLEAERLAQLNPGKRFFVLQALTVSEHCSVVTSELDTKFIPPF